MLAITNERLTMLPQFKFGSPNVCVYCGDIPNGIDHIFSVSSQTIRRRKNKVVQGYGPITSSCVYCNSVLGNKHFDTFGARCFYVYEKLLSKSDKVLWTIEEINALDYSLQRYIQRRQDRLKWLNWRSSWYTTRDFSLNLESLLWEPSLDKTSPKFHEETFNYFSSTIITVKLVYETKK